MSDKYKNISAFLNIPETEKQILEFWEKNKIFYKSINNRKNNKEFTFYDGPPFANGLPHHGHLLTGFAKDLIARYQTMKGRLVNRRLGWDCHGLPAEMAAEKELKISGRTEIKKFGINKFNNHCKKSAMKYSNEWHKYIKKQARWVDFDHSYHTMDLSFMESTLWVFKQLYNKGLIYKSMRVMPYSWKCETPLSNFETKLDNSYREKTSKAITVKFKLSNVPKFISRQDQEIKNCYAIAWTTTPWTLPSNLVLAVGENINYTTIKITNDAYIIAHSQAKNIIKHFKKNKILAEINTKIGKFKGQILENERFIPLFPFFKNTTNAFRILLGDFVVDSEGTGIVHCAPGFGEDDFNLCQKQNIEIICPVDEQGKFTEQIPPYKGIQVFDTNDLIIQELKKQNLWIATEQYIHNYPHCWRTDTPLIYKAMPSWYVKVTEIKDKLIKLNKNINWIPNHIRDNQFGKWLQNARDWSISRNRFWGTPLPLWESDNPAYPRIDVYGSIKDIEKDFNVKIQTLHRPFIDTLTRPNPDDPTGKSTMRRVEDVFDCWFESGAMPYNQVHYPFENKDWLAEHLPADFIVEYVAQTRGWFYTLMVLSTALFNKIPFKNCICHGVVLDENGQKLSKRLNNYIDPIEIMDNYGADALRIAMLSSPIISGGNLFLDKECTIIKNTLKTTINPIWSAYCFFTIYANADKIQAEFNITNTTNFNNKIYTINYMEAYILLKCKEAVKIIDISLSSYDIKNSYQKLTEFFEILNNWYIRRNKKFFWQHKKDFQKKSSYDVLYSVLCIICKAMGPLLPFVSEEIYKGLTDCNFTNNKENSVHLQDYPTYKNILPNYKDASLITNTMDKIRTICATALSIRSLANIRTRQPLESLTYIAKNTDNMEQEQWINLIKDEANVKNIIITNDLTKYGKMQPKINFNLLAKRIPHKIKDIIAGVKQNKWEAQENKIKINDELLSKEECQLVLTPAVKQNNIKATEDNSAIIILDTKITIELYEEGIARDIVRLIQDTRKQQSFHISDYIELFIGTKEDIIQKSIKKWQKYIQKQTLSNKITLTTTNLGNKHTINQKQLFITIKKFER